MKVLKAVFKWIGILLGCIIIATIIGIVIGKNSERASKTVRMQIADKKVVLGMTPSEVRQAWGEPDTISKGIFSGVEVEQWFYKDGYVAFRSGEVVMTNVITQNR
jgi:hypothetical protein